MDRIALISDPHGNLQAMEAVLADIDARGIGKIFNLGDLAGKGPDGAAVIEVYPQNVWHRRQVGPERCDWLAALPGSFDFVLSGRHVRLFHASSTGIFHRVRLTDERDAHLGMFENTAFTGDGPAPSIVGYGDVHTAFAISFAGRTLFNAGSVGNPLDMPVASYAVLEGEYGAATEGPWGIHIVRVPYDIEAAIKAGHASGMPDADAYANELRTARYRGLTRS
jgi:diadenosine tetraphosphatase ApaH/serine/threonine PP2A family protein phosphatase